MIKLNFKNFGLLEILIIASFLYVVGMLMWTASTRPAVEARANLVKENHQKVVDFINEEINKCGNNDEDKTTIWGDPCNGCLLYTSPSPRDATLSRMPSSA